LEDEKILELKILENFRDESWQYEEEITDKLEIEVAKRISYYDRLRKATEEAAAFSGWQFSVPEYTPSNSTTNNSNVTINTNSAEATENIFSRIKSRNVR
jgi:hypothetical protein